MQPRRTAFATLSVLLLAACGDAPVPVDPGPPAPAAAPTHSADDGHDHSPQATATTGTPSWSGEIVLKGPRALSDSGVLMVSLVSRGQRMPRMSYRIPLAGQPPAVDGERRIPFRLDEASDLLRAGLPAELQGTALDLSVRFDQDGVVETREGDVTIAAPVGWGGEGLEIVLGG